MPLHKFRNPVFFHGLIDTLRLRRHHLYRSLKILHPGRLLLYVFSCRTALSLGQHLSPIGLCALGVHIQCLFKKIISLFPLLILQGYLATLKLNGNFIPFLRLGILFLLLFICVQNLGYAPDQILNKADFTHIIRLENRKLFRQIVRIHIPVTGYQQPFPVLLHQSQITAPFIFYPCRIEIFRSCPHYQHNSGRTKGGKYVWLIFLSRLILQSNAGEENPAALLCKFVINILGKRRIYGALPILRRFLVTDKDIKRLFLLDGRQNPPLDGGNLFCLLLIPTFGLSFGMGNGRLKVHILQKTVKAGPVAGGYILPAVRILHILNAKPAQRTAPVSLRIALILLDNALIHCQRFVKLTHAPEVIAPVERSRSLLVIHLRKGRGRATIFTDP